MSEVSGIFVKAHAERAIRDGIISPDRTLHRAFNTACKAAEGFSEEIVNCPCIKEERSIAVVIGDIVFDLVGGELIYQLGGRSRGNDIHLTVENALTRILLLGGEVNEFQRTKSGFTVKIIIVGCQRNLVIAVVDNGIRP